MSRTIIHDVFDEIERDGLSLKETYDKLNGMHKTRVNTELIVSISEIGLDWNDRVLQIECFMMYIEKLEYLPYIIDNGIRVYDPFINYSMQWWNRWMNDFTSAFIYSPYVQQFYQTSLSFPEQLDGRFFPLIDRSCEELASMTNRYISTLQISMQSREFKEKIRHRDDHSRRLFISAAEYVNALFDQHKRMVVLRMDFYLAADAGIGLGGSLVPLLEYFGRLREEMKRRVGVFEHLAGYIAHVEYGFQKKHHIHTVLFFNGDKVRNHYRLSSLIVDQWDHITHGSGRYFNTQEKAGQYACLAIGMVHRDDREKLKCLTYVIWYITKREQFLPYKLEEKQRLFFRGEILS